MSDSRHRFQNHISLLSTFIISLCALDFLLTPDRLGSVKNSFPFSIFLVLGVALYVIGLINQAFIFIRQNEATRRWIGLVVVICAGILSYSYFQAHLAIDGMILAALGCGQLYSITNNPDEGKKNTISLGYACINLISGGMILSGLVDSSKHESLGSLRYYFGILFIVSSITGLLSFLLNHKKTSKILYKLTAIPWLLWVLAFSIASQFNTVFVAIGMAILPLITAVIPWNRLPLPIDDRIGRRFVIFVSTADLIMLISLTTLSYNWKFSATYAFDASNAIPGLSQETALIAMLIFRCFTLCGLFFVLPNLNQAAIKSPIPAQEEKTYDRSSQSGWSQRIARSFKSIIFPAQSSQAKVNIQKEQIAALTHQLRNEKKRTAQLNLLAELNHQLEPELDYPVAAQLVVNTLQQALGCKHIAVFENEKEQQEFSIIASTGTFLPPGYRQNTAKGLLGRTLRLRKTQIVNDTELDADFIKLETSQVKSIFAVPLIYHGHVKAILEVGDDKVNAFRSNDIYLAEMVATELLKAWERSSYHQRLTNLIKAGVTLSPLSEPETTIKEIAIIARETLKAQFTFVTLLDQEGNFSRMSYSGAAPQLLNSLNQNPATNTILQAALHAYEAFRIRDLRKYSKASQIEIGHNELRSLLAIPIRLHRLSIGVILAFGKRGGTFFSENDESLANLLASQAANAVESTWLYQELRNTLSTTTQLYTISVNILKAEELQQAAQHIVETAAKIANATVAGIVLFTKDQQIEAEVEIDENGAHPGNQHPMDLIQQTLESGQIIHITPDQISATICFPLQTPIRKHGALWINVPNIRKYFSRHDPIMRTLSNQAILALERSILLIESQHQAKAIEAAYEELETTYDHTLAALMSALDARDRETEGHSTRVSELARLLGAELGLDAISLKAIERGSLLHDIGKIGVSDIILHKPSQLTQDEWEAMHLHPDIGVRIIEDIPFLQDTLPIIRYHQERWDGSGYPAGLSGKDIPLQARIFAVADAFDALISDRPYRKRISVNEALEYVKEQSGVLYDPEIVSAFVRMWEKNDLENLVS
jgi:response regulator RpfG family c-di-GMP phosphodiesterase/GAF domain-containing protein